MKKSAYIVALLLAVLYFLTAPNSNTKAESYKVISVIDGDTLILKNNNQQIHVRLIGIDAPEMHDNEKARRDSERSGVDIVTIMTFGKQAQNHMRQLINLGTEVKLISDVAKLDKYGRTLAYVYSLYGEFINLRMVEDGYAYPFRIPPNVKFEKTFREAARQAREKKLGLWKDK